MYKITAIIAIITLGIWPVHASGQELVANAVPVHGIDQHESLLINALENIKVNNIRDALTDIEHLVKVEPNFKLAQLIYADLLLARSRPITDFGNFSALPYGYISSLKEEARARWQHHLAPPNNGMIPDFLVQLSEEQKYVITVDMSASRLYLF